MSPSSLLRVAIFLVPALWADFLPHRFQVSAPDSAETRRLYGTTSFSNPASRTNVVVSEPGVLTFLADTILSEGTVGHSAVVGLNLPIYRDRRVADLRGLSAISFELRLSAKPTGGLDVSLRSPGYGGTFDEEGKTYGQLLAPAVLPDAGVWKTFTLPIEDFLPPAWWTPDASFPEIDSILKLVEALQFSPKTLYGNPGTRNGEACANCVGPTTPEVVMELRHLAIVGIFAPGTDPELFSCEDFQGGYLLDDFRDGDSTNQLGGSWFASTDTSSSVSKIDDSGRGSSEVRLEIQAGDAQASGFVRLRADLRKVVEESPKWRPYAGWASLSANFEGEGTLQMEAFEGLSFQLRMEKPGAYVPGILLKVLSPGIAPEDAFQALIPRSVLDPASPLFRDRICISNDDLRQPHWVRNPNGFHANKIDRLVWEARIDDHFDPSIVQDSVEFLLSSVRIHCWQCQDAVRSRLRRMSFSVDYAKGRLTVRPPAGFERISVVSASGRVAARYTTKVQGELLDLERGTWVVVARNAKGESLVRTIAVLR